MTTGIVNLLFSPSNTLYTPPKGLISSVITFKWSLIYVRPSIIRKSHETKLKKYTFTALLYIFPLFYAASENKKCRWLWKLWLYLRSSCYFSSFLTSIGFMLCPVTMRSILEEVCHLSQVKVYSNVVMYFLAFRINEKT